MKNNIKIKDDTKSFPVLVKNVSRLNSLIFYNALEDTKNGNGKKYNTKWESHRIP